MAESNGNKWTMWMAGIMATVITSAMFMIGNNVIANEKDSRARDDCITEKVQKTIVEQQQTNQAILIALKEIQTDIKYIKKSGNGS